MGVDRDTLMLQAAVARGLMTRDDARTCLDAARASGRSVEALLVERRVLAPGVVQGLQATLPPLEPTLQPPPATHRAVAPAGDATWWNQGVTHAAPPLAPDAHVSSTSRTAAYPSSPGPTPVRRVFGAGSGTLLPGSVLGGDWEVLETLGAGGMGAVYRARQVSLGREVALKVLPPDASSPVASERFLREARAAAAVSHPNVITVFAAGRDEATGQLFIAMELVKGGDAAALLARHGGRLPERRALEIARDVARGLTALEAARLVHRDVKPANMFLAADGTAKLADLGLARGLADRMTETGAVVGTPAYMSPEQAQGTQGELDIGTDIYAVGASLYTLLTGKPPFQGPSVVALLRQVLDAPPPDPRVEVPTVSSEAAAVVARAMAKDRRSRHATAAELAADLERALARLESATPRGGAPVLLLGALVLVGVVSAAAGVVLMTSSPDVDADRDTTSAPPTDTPPPTTPTEAPPTVVEPASETPPPPVREPVVEKARVHEGALVFEPPGGLDVDVADLGGLSKNGTHFIFGFNGRGSITARFDLEGDPTWVHLVLAHSPGVAEGVRDTFVDVFVNDALLVGPVPPQALGWVDITSQTRAGRNEVKVAFNRRSTTVYWFKAIEVRYGWGKPPLGGGR